jgi:hypothetical protein
VSHLRNRLFGDEMVVQLTELMVDNDFMQCSEDDIIINRISKTGSREDGP